MSSELRAGAGDRRPSPVARQRWAAALATLLALHAAAAATPAPEQPNLRETVAVRVVRQAKDAVVYITAEKVVARSVSPFGNDPFFGQFGRQTILERQNSLGSGFIVHEQGYIVTNNHVIDRARRIAVQLSDGRRFPAEVLSADPDADLAVLRIDTGETLHRLELGDSSDLMIGEPVIAVGNPLGLSYSVSTGIVSAIHREIRPSPNAAPLTDLIQTDAAINPGNSGGPLLNAYGQVIGINTAIRGDAQNIGFAIQVNRLRELIPALLDPANVRRIAVPVEMTERRELTPPAGVRSIVELVTPAGRDVVESVAGRPVRDIVDAYVRLLEADLARGVDIVAGGKVHRIVGTPLATRDPAAIARRRLGMNLVEVTPELARRFNLAIEDGLLITEVAANSVAQRAQLQPGDVIFQVGLYRVRTLQDFGDLLSRLPDRGSVRVGILRNDAVGYTVLRF
ncbi:MAG: trypsin-like peptidase domain-containing protein [Tepidisphaerales bacterium]